MYPTHITVRLDENQSSYSHSKYYLAPQFVYVKDRFGNLAIGRSMLIAEDEYHTRFLAQAA